MSMNIGPMLRALMGEAQPADSRSLELRIGQIVRGVLMEMLENQEALVNINGIQVKAKLDAEMAVGKSTLLQVQPGGAGGLVTLKPLTDASEAMPEEGLKDVLKTFGLPEQKWAMELLRGLKRDGFPIGKDTAAFFHAAAALKPAGVDAASWSSASDVAFRRGLAPTETTLSSLRQALFGQPIQDELANFRAAVDSWLSGANKPAGDTAALGQKLQNLLSQGAALLAEGESQLLGEEAQSNSGAAKGTDAEKAQAANSVRDAANSKLAGEAGKFASDAALAKGDGTKASANTATAAGTTAQATQQQSGAASAKAGGPPEAPRSATMPPELTRPAAESTAAPSAANRPAAAAAVDAAADSRRASSADGAQPSAPKPEAAWIGRFLQWLGVGHERQLLHAAEARLPGGDAGLAAGAAASGPVGADAPGQEARHAAETLKGALLALAAHDDVPPALREAAQTLANQVTGQQLLLTSDRNNVAPFSHMTLFVPMKGAEGDTTATVHVQTRRSRRGEWDVDNCHLLFDLRMRNLGDTLVDVQVVDRIVSLKLLSDFSGMSALIEQAREELASGMSSAGFQLLSLSTSPLPQWKNGSVASTLPAAVGEKTAVASAYSAKPYKGVDYRA
ncbi:hypothetical protein [Cohnella herbarum]|uniref:Flagellar hook-length control protein FliK n=1 Tax=Cohnella herbarum TaxID=2728023 RepID=A0A7Z2VIA5_9BACL|nr:hypothetical protein [Cohnella herbarum]QJD83400.1 hypothetical protein HH215_09560 [Cohnella herbarum]